MRDGDRGGRSLGRSGRGLDGLNFFMANVQTGFGPFISVYLTAEAWTQGQIGLALSIGTAAFMVSQVPAGALVDAVRSKRGVTTAAILAITACALSLALIPARLPVYVAELVHGAAGCVVTPAIAAMSMAVAAEGGISFGERLGRNARFASIGSGLAAAAMGAIGYWVSERSVFLLTVVLALPALWFLRMIHDESDVTLVAAAQPETVRQPLAAAFLDYRLIIFAVCCAGFHLANAAMLPLAAAEITKQAGSVAELVIAACIVGPQLIVAALSPAVGRLAETHGRRVVLLVGFSAVPVRGILLAMSSRPEAVVLFQLLDGVSAAVFGVLLPLVVADITRGTGRFNLCMGAIGLAIGAGATLSTTLAGFAADTWQASGAFLGLASAGAAAVGLLWLCMPDTALPRMVESQPRTA